MLLWTRRSWRHGSRPVKLGGGEGAPASWGKKTLNIFLKPPWKHAALIILTAPELEFVENGCVLTEIGWFKIGDSKSTFEHDSERKNRQIESRSAKSAKIRPKSDPKSTKTDTKAVFEKQNRTGQRFFRVTCHARAPACDWTTIAAAGWRDYRQNMSIFDENIMKKYRKMREIQVGPKQLPNLQIN